MTLSAASRRPPRRCSRGRACRARNERLPSPARKQRSWLSRLAATGRPRRRRARAPRGFVRSASGKRSRPSVAGRQRREHVGLVLGRVVRRRPAAGPRRHRRPARSGRWRGVDAPEPVGERDHRVDAKLAVADHAGVRRSPCRVAARRTRRRPAPKGLLEIQRQVGMPIEWASARAPSTASGEQQLRAPSLCRSAHSFSVTATTSAPALALAAARRPRSRPRRSSPPARARRWAAVRQRDARRGRGRQRAVKGVRGELRRVAALRGEAAERLRYSAGADPRPPRARVRALGQLGDGRGGGRVAAAQPSASKVAASIAPSAITTETRTRSPHTEPAGRAAERARGRGRTMRVVALRRGRSKAASTVTPRLARPRPYFG